MCTDDQAPIEDESSGSAGARLPADAASPGRAPRVFVSYTHDDAAHIEAVLELCRLLRTDAGVDVRMDRWDLDQRRDWYLWAGEQLTAADYVLVIASPLCKRVGEGRIENRANRGMQSELSMLRELLHSDRDAWRRRILPVVLPGRTPDEIPLFLQPQTCDHYVVEDLTSAGAEDLLRAITRQPAYLPPPINQTLIHLPPKSADTHESVAENPPEEDRGTANAVTDSPHDQSNENTSRITALAYDDATQIIINGDNHGSISL